MTSIQKAVSSLLKTLETSLAQFARQKLGKLELRYKIMVSEKLGWRRLLLTGAVVSDPGEFGEQLQACLA